MDVFPEIPGYKIEKKLVEGRISDIYLGVQEDLERQVAIKVLNPELFADKKFADNFRKESRKLTKFSHPNIVNILDVGDYDDILFVVMEYLPYGLRNLISQPDQRPRGQEVLEILEQVASSFEYAHKEGVIHKDIRPDNIRFREDGTLAVVGFFISKVIGSGDTLKKRGMIAGTPQYASPEQALRKHLDGATDIYSLGITLYEMLTGSVPYDAEEAIAVENQHIMEPIPQLPDDLLQFQPLLDNMMAKDKEERIHNGKALIQQVRALDSNLRSVPQKNHQRPITPASSTMESDLESSLELELEFGAAPDPKGAGDAPEPDPLQLDLDLDSEPVQGLYSIPKPGSSSSPWSSSIGEPEPAKVDEPVEQEKAPPPPPRKPPKPPEPQKPPKKSKRPSINIDFGELLSSLSNPRVLVPVAGVVVIVIVLMMVLGGSSPDEDNGGTAETVAAGTKPLTPEEQKQLDTQYKYKFGLAQKFFKSSQFKKALDKIKEAEKFKKTEETRKLGEQIAAKLSVKSDDDAYKKAMAAGTAEAFEGYMKKFPAGAHAKKAEEKIRSLNAEEEKQKTEQRRWLASRITLRSQYATITVEDVKQMLTSRGFFDKYYNKTGNFKNRMVLKKVGSDKLVTDYATGLEWHQSGSENYMKLGKVGQWLAELNKKTYAGHSDWRLPTLEEAASLLESSENQSRLFTDGIFSREQQYIWTGDSLDTTKTWAIDFFGGDVNRVGSTFTAFVRPVRSMK
ncbi:MAG: protein kinase [bacterium]|nr:protein kinase [bacterium]